jgi:hypothetical protein
MRLAMKEMVIAVVAAVTSSRSCCTLKNRSVAPESTMVDGEGVFMVQPAPLLLVKLAIPTGGAVPPDRAPRRQC